MMATERAPGYSFCIITDGRRPELLRAEIESIRALKLPVFEIIVAGQPPTELAADVRTLFAPDDAIAGRLGAMRNAACAHAQYDHLVVADDDMYFHPSFGEGLIQAGYDYDVLCVRLLNPDGTRFWDWATHGGPRGHMLLNYDDTDDFVYVTGGLAVMRAAVFDQVQWDAARGFYQGEDLDWSSRVRAAGFSIRLNAHATVTHEDARYTQHGNILQFRQDLTQWERLSSGIDAMGFYRGGPEGCRWMSDCGTLRIAPTSEHAGVLRFTLSSIAPSLTASPFGVGVYVNEKVVGRVEFNGEKQLTLSVPLAAMQPTHVRLQSERSIPGTAVGIPDDRPVSVLIHDVCRVAA